MTYWKSLLAAEGGGGGGSEPFSVMLSFCMSFYYTRGSFQELLQKIISFQDCRLLFSNYKHSICTKDKRHVKIERVIISDHYQTNVFIFRWRLV